MTDKQKPLILTFLIGVICFLIWKFSGISLASEMPPDYSVYPFPTANTNKERFVYLIFSTLLSICFFFPFYISKKASKVRVILGAILSMLILALFMDYISSNTKGLLLSNWFGEDYGFTINIIKGFFLFPFFYYFLNRFAFIKLPIRSLIYLFTMSFVIYFLSKFISLSVLDGIVSTIRHILLDGYFIFFYVIAFGLISIDAKIKYF